MGGKVMKIIVLVIGLYLVFVLSKSLFEIKKAGGRVFEAKERLLEAKRENQILQAKLKEVNSSQFIEKEAREKLNLQRPGEVVLVVPEDLGMENDTFDGEKVKVEANWEKWWRLFFE